MANDPVGGGGPVFRIWPEPKDPDEALAIARMKAAEPPPAEHVVAARKLGVPLPVAATQGGELARRAEIQDLLKASEGAPVTQSLIADPVRGELVKDDAEHLSWIERSFRMAEGRFDVGMRQMRIGENWFKRWAGVETPEDTLNLKIDEATDEEEAEKLKALDIGTGFKVPQALRGKAVLGLPVEWLERAAGEAADVPYAVLEAVPQTARGAALGIAGGLAGGPVGAFTAMTADMAMIETGNAYKALLEPYPDKSPADPELARFLAPMVGVANGAIETLSFGVVFRKVPILKRYLRAPATKAMKQALLADPVLRGWLSSIARQAGTGALSEGSEEILQSLTQIGARMTQAVEQGEDPTPVYTITDADGKQQQLTGWAAIFAELVEAGLGGAKAGLGLGAGAGALERAAKPREIRKAKERAKFLEDLGRRVEGMKLTQNDPQTVQEHVQRIVSASPQEFVLVSPDHFETLFQNASEADEAAFMGAVPDMQRRMDDARQDRADVQIPTGAFTAHILKTDLGRELIQDTRWHPNEMTPREAAAAEEAEAEAARRRVAEVGAAPEEAAPEDAFTRYEQAIQQRLEATGESALRAHEVAVTEGAQVRAFAEAGQMTPEEAIREGGDPRFSAVWEEEAAGEEGVETLYVTEDERTAQRARARQEREAAEAAYFERGGAEEVPSEEEELASQRRGLERVLARGGMGPVEREELEGIEQEIRRLEQYPSLEGEEIRELQALRETRDQLIAQPLLADMNVGAQLAELRRRETRLRGLAARAQGGPALRYQANLEAIGREIERLEAAGEVAETPAASTAALPTTRVELEQRRDELRREEREWLDSEDPRRREYLRPIQAELQRVRAALREVPEAGAAGSLVDIARADLVGRTPGFVPIQVGTSPGGVEWVAYRPEDVQPMRERLRAVLTARAAVAGQRIAAAVATRVEDPVERQVIELEQLLQRDLTDEEQALIAEDPSAAERMLNYARAQERRRQGMIEDARHLDAETLDSALALLDESIPRMQSDLTRLRAVVQQLRTTGMEGTIERASPLGRALELQSTADAIETGLEHDQMRLEVLRGERLAREQIARVGAPPPEGPGILVLNDVPGEVIDRVTGAGLAILREAAPSLWVDWAERSVRIAGTDVDALIAALEAQGVGLDITVPLLQAVVEATPQTPEAQAARVEAVARATAARIQPVNEMNFIELLSELHRLRGRPLNADERAQLGEAAGIELTAEERADQLRRWVLAARAAQVAVPVPLEDQRARFRGERIELVDEDPLVLLDEIETQQRRLSDESLTATEVGQAQGLLENAQLTYNQAIRNEAIVLLQGAIDEAAGDVDEGIAQARTEAIQLVNALRERANRDPNWRQTLESARMQRVAMDVQQRVFQLRPEDFRPPAPPAPVAPAPAMYRGNRVELERQPGPTRRRLRSPSSIQAALRIPGITDDHRAALQLELREATENYAQTAAQHYIDQARRDGRTDQDGLNHVISDLESQLESVEDFLSQAEAVVAISEMAPPTAQQRVQLGDAQRQVVTYSETAQNYRMQLEALEAMTPADFGPQAPTPVTELPGPAIGAPGTPSLAQRILADPAASYWLKDALRAALAREIGPAIADARLLRERIPARTLGELPEARISDWLNEFWTGAMARDSVDAMNDAETLLMALAERMVTLPTERETLFQILRSRLLPLSEFGAAGRYLLEAERYGERIGRNIQRYFRELAPSAREIAATALAGRVKRGWYERSRAAIQMIWKTDAPRFTALLAALSPRVGVEIDAENTIRVWNAWHDAGRPLDRETILNLAASVIHSAPAESLSDKGLGARIRRSNKLFGTRFREGRRENMLRDLATLSPIQQRRFSVLEAWEDNLVQALSWDEATQGPISLENYKLSPTEQKADSFFRNLMGDMSPVTADAWIATFFGILGDELGVRGKYIAVAAKVRQAAELLTRETGETWTPAEVQETVWSWARALRTQRMSSTEQRAADQIIRDNGLSEATIAGTVDFQLLFAGGVWRALLGAGEAGLGERADLAAARGRRAAELARRAATRKEKAALGGMAAQKRHTERAAKRIEQQIQRGIAARAAQRRRERAAARARARETLESRRADRARRDGDRLHLAALRNIPQTRDPREAGYVLSGGEMLDFSGSNQGGMPGMRAIDHRDLDGASPNEWTEDAGLDVENGTDRMYEFMRLTGAVRVNFPDVARFGRARVGPATADAMGAISAAQARVLARSARQQGLGLLLEQTIERVGQATTRSLELEPGEVTADRIFSFFSGAEEGETLEMAQQGRIEFDPDLEDVRVVLREARTAATAFHELSHLWWERLRKLAGRPNPRAQVVADWQAVARFVGATEGQPLTAQQKELLARATEAYAREGVAPSLRLRRAFDHFRTWFTQIYRTHEELERQAGQQIVLTDEIRAVMGRLLATEDEIQAARRQRGMNLMPTALQEQLMTPAEREEYRQVSEDAVRTVREQVTREALAGARRDIGEEVEAHRQEIEAEMTAEVDARPEVRARHWLTTGEWLGGAPTDIEGPIPHKRMDKTLLIELVGAERVQKMPFGAHGWTQAEGLHPDVVAELFGFGSVTDLIGALESIKGMNREALVEAAMKERVQEEFGAIDALIGERAAAAIGEIPESFEQLRLEERAYARRAGTKITPRHVVAEAARRIVRETPVLELQPHKYRVAAEKAGRQALEHAAAGRMAQAQAAKHQQQLDLALEAEARKAKAQSEKNTARMRFMDSETAQSVLGKAGHTYTAQMDAFLERFEFRNRTRPEIERSESLGEWLAAQEKLGETPPVPSQLRNEAYRKNWKRMTVGELQDVRDSAEAIYALARAKVEYLHEGKLRERHAVQGELIAQTAGRYGPIPPLADSQALHDTPGEERKSWVYGILASLDKIEAIVDWLDRGDINGAFHRYVYRPIAERNEWKNDKKKKYAEAFAQMISEHIQGKGREYSAEHVFPELLVRDEFDRAVPARLTKLDMIAILNNMGNESNETKFLSWYGWNRDLLMGVFARYLTKSDVEFTQKTWDLIDTLWPEIAALEKRRYGVEPERVIAREFEILTSDGQRVTLRGGYYPVVYDPTKARWAYEHASHRVFEGIENHFMRAITGHGHTHSRTEIVGPILFDLAVIPRHLEEVIHDLAFREVLLQVDTLLNNDAVHKALTVALGHQKYAKLFLPWLQGIAGDPKQSARGLSDWDKFLKHLRINGSAAVMYFRWTTMLAQTLGHFPGQAEMRAHFSPEQIAKARATRGLPPLGPGESWEKHYTLALGTLLRDPREQWKGLQAIQALSGFMRHRIPNMERDLRQQMNEIRGRQLLEGRPARTRDAILKAGAISIGGTQILAVDRPLWEAAFQAAQHLLGHTEKDATALADSIVRLSQGSGEMLDLSAFQRGNEGYKLLSAFMSYPATQAAAFLRDLRAYFGKDFDLGELAMRQFQRFTIPAVGMMGIATLKYGKPPWDDDDDDWWDELFAFVQATGALDLFGALPVAREIASAFKYKRVSPTLAVRGYEEFSKLFSAKDLASGADSVARGIGYWTGIPYPVLSDTVKDIKRWLGDEED